MNYSNNIIFRSRPENRQGFTLIELMLVIAIIGILASIILVNLSAAKLKATDAFFMSQAYSVMQAAQVDSIATGNYGAWNNYCVSFSCGSCSTNMITTCENITASDGTMLVAGYGGNNPKLSIVVWLPGKQRYYCIGSNGRSSSNTGLSSTCDSPPIGPWACPGCPFDPLGGGS